MFWRFRTLLFWFSLGIASVFFAAFGCFPCKILKLSYHIRYKVATAYSHLFVLFGRYICGAKYNVFGLEKLPNEPFIALANHQSFWENMFMQLIIPIHSWVLKKELLKVPLFGPGLKMMEVIVADRDEFTSVSDILKQGKEKIDAGLSIVMFPEATRIPPGKCIKFKPSAAKLAISTNTPIALIVHNAGLTWTRRFWFKRSGLITVKVIEIINREKLSSFSVRELNEYIEKVINTEKERI